MLALYGRKHCVISKLTNKIVRAIIQCLATDTETPFMEWEYDDGGRSEGGYRGSCGDCGVRACAIATGKQYREVYKALFVSAGKSPRDGVSPKAVGKFLEANGFIWTPTMSVGQGCKVHVRRDELPAGILVLRLSRHYAAVRNGVLRDTYDCSRGGTRCVYGYWIREE